MAKSGRTSEKPGAAKRPARGGIGRRKVAAVSPHGTKSDDPRVQFGDEEWRDMVATAAYYRAESRGFDGTSIDDDWYEAEAELRSRLSSDDNSEADDSGPGGNTAPSRATGKRTGQS